MQQIPGVHIQGSDRPEEHNGIISFTVDGVHPHDIASILDAANVMRAGHHCAQPLLKHLGVFCNSACQLCVLQYGGGHRPFCPEPERNPEENGIWRIEPFTMKY